MSKHTKGPWQPWQLSNDSGYGADAGKLIVTAEGGEIEICGIVENPADAHLIAAAPDLLDALRGMTAFFSPKPGQGVVIDCVVKALYAIEKAEGRS